MQYGARFFSWWFATTDPALSQRAFKLYRTTQRSRKAFRMLKVNTAICFRLFRGDGRLQARGFYIRDCCVWTTDSVPKHMKGAEKQ